jgi:UDP-N-acetylglucosamine 2-epimerase (non-hydrolysing)
MKTCKVMTVFGTRPEAIKMAPLVHELSKHTDQIESVVCVTAQHRQMLDQVLEIFAITPDYDLNIMKDRQTLVDVTTRALQSQVSIGHVEAGLRTWDKYSPFPEEMNRQLTGVMADLHFSPTNGSADNLRRENKPEEAIYITGNTAIDALKTTVREDYTHPVLDRVAGHKMVLMTAHRRENLGEPMKRIFRAVRRLVDEHPEIAVVYPVHLNPAVQEVAQEVLGGHERIQLIDPLDAFDFHNFARRAHLILTDSGGVQEEAPSLGVPVLVLRDTTERPEGIEAGTLKLAGTDEERVYQMTKELLTNQAAYEEMAHAANPYGDGEASRRIVEAILHHYGLRSERPAPFEPGQS